MKISLHRALAQIKSTAARLEPFQEFYGINGVYTFLAYKEGEKTVTNIGATEADTEKKIRASFDKFEALFNNLVNRKMQITYKNSGASAICETDFVTVCNKKYTVAQLLAVVPLMGYKKDFLTVLKRTYSEVSNNVSRKNELVSQRIDDQLKSMGGGDKSTLAPELLTATVEQLRNIYEYKLVDPIGIVAYMAKLENEINTFEAEADAALSEFNALNYIEVEDDDIAV